jgi:predicted peptidase
MKQKLFKINASVWFNKQCKIFQLTPKYTQIYTEDNNSRNTKEEMAIKFRINQELNTH